MDGTQPVQRLVQPGESFDCRFELPDAGTLWYDSHANVTVQIERGLYGAIVVLGPDEPAFWNKLRVAPRAPSVASIPATEHHAAGDDGPLRGGALSALASPPR